MRAWRIDRLRAAATRRQRRQRRLAHRPPRLRLLPRPRRQRPARRRTGHITRRPAVRRPMRVAGCLSQRRPLSWTPRSPGDRSLQRARGCHRRVAPPPTRPLPRSSSRPIHRRRGFLAADRATIVARTFRASPPRGGHSPRARCSVATRRYFPGCVLSPRSPVSPPSAQPSRAVSRRPQPQRIPAPGTTEPARRGECTRRHSAFR